jgi:hypothetical protein
LLAAARLAKQKVSYTVKNPSLLDDQQKYTHTCHLGCNSPHCQFFFSHKKFYFDYTGTVLIFFAACTNIHSDFLVLYRRDGSATVVINSAQARRKMLEVHVRARAAILWIV